MLKSAAMAALPSGVPSNPSVAQGARWRHAVVIGMLALGVALWWVPAARWIKVALTIAGGALVAVVVLAARQVRAEAPQVLGVVVSPDRIVPWAELPAAVRAAIGTALPVGHAVWACTRLGTAGGVAEWWWVDEMGEIQARWVAQGAGKHDGRLEAPV